MLLTPNVIYLPAALTGKFLKVSSTTKVFLSVGVPFIVSETLKLIIGDPVPSFPTLNCVTSLILSAF